MPTYRTPSKILCKVVDIDLKAEPGTEEPIAEIKLSPEPSDDVLPSNQIKRAVRAASFSKRLTTSDTNPGGLLFPQNDAEECFPRLDMSEQNIVAKDFHGKEWHFRHTRVGIRAQNKLSTGWSKFVTDKKLAEGDYVMFVRGEGRDIFIGIRRGQKPKLIGRTAVVSSMTMKHGILASALHSVSTGCMFTVCYRPWRNPYGFLVSYEDYMRYADIDFVPRTRFKMKIPDRDTYKYFEGKVFEVSDKDEVRWQNSEWKNIRVSWDFLTARLDLPLRVSHWMIEPLDTSSLKKKPGPSSTLVG